MMHEHIYVYTDVYEQYVHYMCYACICICKYIYIYAYISLLFFYIFIYTKMTAYTRTWKHVIYHHNKTFVLMLSRPMKLQVGNQLYMAPPSPHVNNLG